MVTSAWRSLMQRKALVTFALASILACPAPAAAGPFEDGAAAYERGD